MRTANVLLNGKGMGLPLFLAWVGGVAASVGLQMVLINSLPFDSTWQIPIGCRIGLCVWQAMLLFSSWWRRLLWIGVFTLLATGNFENALRVIWLAPAICSPVIQTFVLIGVRRRTWLWGLSAGCLVLLPVSWMGMSVEFYEPIAKMIGRVAGPEFVLPFADAFDFGVATLFGALVAFFMPPVDSTKSPGWGKGASGTGG